MYCSTYKCNKPATYEILAVLEKHTPNRRVVQFYSCKDCVGYESEAIVSVVKFSKEEFNALYGKISNE
jgi:hypothetical protein